jgi:hypothetical protein
MQRVVLTQQVTADNSQAICGRSNTEAIGDWTQLSGLWSQRRSRSFVDIKF